MTGLKRSKDPGRFQAAVRALEAHVECGSVPGGVLLVAQRGEVLCHAACGSAQETPATRPMTPSTLFDLASLTKVVVTATLALRLAEADAWAFDDPLARHLPAFAPFGRGGITLAHLLSHTSGLIPWANLFYRGRGRETVETILFEDKWPILTPVHPPGRWSVYSDLNYVLLGLALERVAGQPLDALAEAWVFQPAGMEAAGFNPDPARGDTAATEDDPARGGVLVGTVHDENAWALEGVSGHAGLFSTAWDLALFAQALLDGGQGGAGRVLAPESVRRLTARQPGTVPPRAFGWLLQSPETPSGGRRLSERAFGHTGFTGTSLWVDPALDLIVVLLTIRVLPERQRGRAAIDALRAAVHDAAVDEANGFH